MVSCSLPTNSRLALVVLARVDLEDAQLLVVIPGVGQLPEGRGPNFGGQGSLGAVDAGSQLPTRRGDCDLGCFTVFRQCQYGHQRNQGRDHTRLAERSDDIGLRKLQGDEGKCRGPVGEDAGRSDHQQRMTERIVTVFTRDQAVSVRRR